MDVGRRGADEAAIILFQRLPRRGMPLLFVPSTLACATSAHQVRDMPSPSRCSAGKTYASLCVVFPTRNDSVGKQLFFPSSASSHQGREVSQAIVVILWLVIPFLRFVWTGLQWTLIVLPLSFGFNG